MDMKRSAERCSLCKSVENNARPSAPAHLLLAHAISLLFIQSPTTGRTSIFFHNENTTLYRSAPRTWTLPRIAHRCSNDSSRISPGFRPETPPRLSRQLQRTTLKPAAFFKNATAAISGKSDDTGAALSPTKVDIIVVGKRKVEVPRGRPFSERVWTECNNGNRRVMFSPNVEVRSELCVREVVLVGTERAPSHTKDTCIP